MSAAVFTNNDGTDSVPTNSYATVTGPAYGTGDYTLTVNTALAMSIIGTSATIDQTLYIKTIITNYNTQKVYTPITITINQATCDCTALLWTNPTATAVTAAVAATTTQAFPLPVQDTTNTATNGAFAKCFLTGGPGCASTGTFPIASVKYDDNSPSGIALPNWFEIAQASDNAQNLVIKPTAAAHIGTHKINVVFDSTYGPNPNYHALTITVTCQVVSIAQPSNPTTNLSYNVYDPSNTAHSWTATDYTQTPPCGYTLASSFAWEGVSTPAALSSTNGSLVIYTTKKANAGTFALKLANTVTISSNGPAGSSTFTPSGDSEKVVFTVTVVDPCSTATINDLVFTPSTLAVVDGASASVTFTVPLNSVMVTHSDPALLCGTTSFGVFTDTSDTAVPNNWAVITGPIAGVYTVLVDTTKDLSLIADEASKTHTLQLKSTLDGYTSQIKRTALTVSISAASCDCSALAWTNPSADSSATIAVGATQTLTVPVPTADTSATSTNNLFQKCYAGSGTCPTTGKFLVTTGITTSANAALPVWITYTSSGNKVQTISVAPTSGAHIGTHVLQATFTSDNGPDPTYTAFSFVVTCAVTGFTKPSNPSNVSYTLFTKSV
jgi:hypothetical protein